MKIFVSPFYIAYNRTSRLLIVIFSVSMLARLLFSWVVYQYLANDQIAADNWPDSYALFAQNLIHGHGFCIYPGEPSIMRGPIYPLFGALIFRVFGTNNLAGTQFVQAIIDGLTAIVVFFIGNKIFNRKVGFIAASLFALYPLSIWYSARMSMVSLLTFLYTFMSWLVIRSTSRLSSRLSIVIGLLLGVTTLTLPITMLFPFFLLATWLIMCRSYVKVLRQILLVCVVMVLVMLPWTIRNHDVTHHFVPVSAGGGYAFILGDLFVDHFDGFSPYSAQYPSEREMQALANERVKTILSEENASASFSRLHIDIGPVASKILDNYALRSIIQRPLHFTKKVCIQFLTFWYLGNNKLKTLAILIIQLVFLLPWLASGMYFSLMKCVKPVIPVLILISYLNFTYAATGANARHGMPAMPLALVIAAFGISEIIMRAQTRRKENGILVQSSSTD